MSERTAKLCEWCEQPFLGLQYNPAAFAQRRFCSVPCGRASLAGKVITPLIDRFNAKVGRGATEDDCWTWHGSTNKTGYGQIGVGRKIKLATHVSLELHGQPRPVGDNANALHSCDNPPCCNPKHLSWGTRKRNQREMVERGRARLEGLEIGHARVRAMRLARPITVCTNCKVEFFTNRKKQRENHVHFCGNPCASAWRKAQHVLIASAQGAVA